MADAEKREKVIRGLECCLKFFNQEGCPEECPYRSDGRCYETIRRDALALLQEQEPRVLTWKDVKESIGVPVWVEYEDYDSWNGYGVPTSYYRNLDYGDCVLFGANAYSAHYENTYNMKWRCWTSRPTPEQMRETPWEADSDA